MVVHGSTHIFESVVLIAYSCESLTAFHKTSELLNTDTAGRYYKNVALSLEMVIERIVWY